MNQAVATPDPSAQFVSAVTADTQEVRLATTMTGGVSLAVWMGGVAREIDLLMQASRTRWEQEPGSPDEGSQRRGPLNAADLAERQLYARLIQLLDVVVEVDVLSGTSAGGVNAVMLAYARANNGDLGGLRNLWLDLGALLDLLRQPTDSDVPSLLYGDRWMFRQLADKLPGLGSKSPPGKPPSTTLYVTTTLLTGETGRFTDDLGTLVQDSNQRGLFNFTEADLTTSGVEGALALAGRSTASFPGAFEPSFVPFLVPTPPDGDIPARPAMGAYANFTRDHWVVDGGVLNNQPLDVMLERIFDRRAKRPVRRVLLFVVPSAGPAPDLVEAAPADTITNPYGLLPGLLKVVSAATGQSISGSLRAIVAHNDRIDSRTDLRIQLAEVANRLAPARLLTPSLLDDCRVRQGERQARPLVMAAMRLLSTWPPQTAATPVGIPDDWQPLLLPGGTAEAALRMTMKDALTSRWPRSVDANGTPSPAALPASGAVLALYGRSAYDNGKSIAIAVVRLAYQAATTTQDRAELTELNAAIHTAVGKPVRPDPTKLAEAVFAAAVGKVIPKGSADPSFRAAGADLAAAWVAGTSVSLQAWDNLAAVLKARADRIANAAQSTPPGSRLRTYVDYLRLDEDASAISTRLFDLAVAEDALLPVDAGNYQPVELVQVSADTRSLLTPGIASAGGKLTGLQFHNFGAFYKKSWRANDWMWGRLDGAGWLVHALLDPRRLLVVTDSQPAGGRAVWLLSRLETFGAVPLDKVPAVDGVPMRAVLAEELAFLDGKAMVPQSIPHTSTWLASAWQHGIAADELPKLARVILGVPDPGPGQPDTSRPGAARPGAARPGQPVDRSPSDTLTWASTVLEPGIDLDAQLAKCPVPKETFKTDMGSPLMVRTMAKAAATTTAAVSSVSQVPGPVRPAVTTAHTIALSGYRVANTTNARPRNLIIVGLVLLALGVAAAAQSADLFGIAGLVVAAIGAYLVTFGTWQLSGTLFAALVAVTITGAVASLAFPAVRQNLFGTSESDAGYVGRHVYWLGSDWWHPLLAVGVLMLVIVLIAATFSRARPRKRRSSSRG